MGFELRNRLVGRERHLRLPALHGDAAIFGVNAGDDAVRANAGSEFRGKFGVDRALRGEKRRADDDSLCASGENLASALDGVDGVELVGDAQYHARDIGAVRNQLRIVRDRLELPVDATAGIELCHL